MTKSETNLKLEIRNDTKAAGGASRTGQNARPTEMLVPLARAQRGSRFPITDY